MTAADDMKAAFDNHHEAYRQGLLAGARAMQEAAAMEIEAANREGPYQAIAGAKRIRALDPEKVGG